MARDPLAYFLLLSAGVFALDGLRSAVGRGEAAGRIIVTAGEIESLKAGFSRTWLRPPSDEELPALIEDHVRTEVLAREAVAMGLDRDDTVIRRHLRMKVETLAEDAVREKPTEADLGAYLAAHAEAFGQEPRFTFRQVYLNPDRRGAALKRDGERLLARLERLGGGADTTTLGDGTMLEPEMKGATRSDVARAFGEEFTAELARLPTARWQGPVASGYGLHLVFLAERQEGRLPELAEVRGAVEREWSAEQVQAGKQKFYERLRGRYAVSVDLPVEAGGR